MRAWFASLAPREQRVVLAGTAVAVLVLVYLLVVEPVAAAFAERERRVESLQSQIEWMRGAAAEVASLRAGGARSRGGSEQPPYLAIDQALRGAGLPQPQRLEPDGDNGARLEFDAVPFDPLVQIIGRLRSESGLRVTRARIQRADAPGTVSARLTFERESG